MVISAKKAQHYSWGKNCDGWHLLNSDSLSVIEEKMPPFTTEELHYHRFAQQVFYILSGDADFEINGKLEKLNEGDSIHVEPKTLHKISNISKTVLHFLVISTPKAQTDRVEIVNYSEELKEHIKTLNIEWLEKYFKVEPIDVTQLSDPGNEIINKGGMIYYARHNSKIVGTVSLLKTEEGIYELGKMAVTPCAQGLGIGKALMEHCFTIASKNNIRKLILYSNTKLEPAIHIYEKYGFNKVQLESGHYERANIKMEKII